MQFQKYTAPSVDAVQVEDINTQALELIELAGLSNDDVEIKKVPVKDAAEEQVVMSIRVGRGKARVWRRVNAGDWILKEWDGTIRVFRDRSFKNTFIGKQA